MLVLGRKKGESFRIGQDIVVKILGKRGNYIQIGIDAPKEIPISREELVKNDNKKQCSRA